MSRDDLSGQEGIAERPVPHTFNFDAAKYLPDIEDLDLAETQKIELLQTLFSIMETFVHLGFDVGAADVCGQVFQDFNKAANGAKGSFAATGATTTEND